MEVVNERKVKKEKERNSVLIFIEYFIKQFTYTIYLISTTSYDWK